MKKVFFIVLLLLQGVVYAQRSSDNPYDYRGRFNDGLAAFRLDNLYGYVNENKKEVVPAQYKNAKDFNEGFAAVQHRSGKWGFINSSGKEVIELKYDEVQPMIGGMSLVKQEGLYGYISKSGQILIPLIHKEEPRKYSNNIIAYNGDKYALYSNTGRRLSDYIYQEINFRPSRMSDTYSEHPYIYVKKDNLHGVLDLNGKEIIPIQYSAKNYFYDNLMLVYKDGLYGYINTSNKIVIPYQFTYAGNFRGEEANVEKDKRSYQIDLKGNALPSKEWIFVYSKNPNLGTQFWAIDKSFPNTTISNKWKEDFTINSVTYAPEVGYFLLMQKSHSSITNRWFLRSDISKINEEISKAWDEKNTNKSTKISHLNYLKDQFLITFTNESRIGNGQYFSAVQPNIIGDFYFSQSNITDRRKDGYWVNRIVYGAREYGYSYVKTSDITDQIILYRAAFPAEEIQTHLRKWYSITQITRDDENYIVVLSRMKGDYKLNNQIVVTNDKLDTKEIQSYWDKGYILTDVVYKDRSEYWK